MSGALTGKTALLVDDSPETLSYLNDALEPTGLTVLLALDGRQALTIAGRMIPDVILLDALMPNLDGFETCKALKADPALSAVPVIFMTGLSDTQSVVRGLELGGVDYLTKPIDPPELIARIQVHVTTAQEARSVRNAMDSMGQRLVRLDAQGRALWLSEQAQALMTKRGLVSAVDQTRAYDEIQQWRAHRPARGQVLNLSAVTLSVTLLSDPAESEALIQLSDPEERPTAETLKAALPVTKRESEVLFWIAKGKTNREIGEILSMSPRTVNKHLETIFPKLAVENRTAAAAVAIRVLESKAGPAAYVK